MAKLSEQKSDTPVPAVPAAPAAPAPARIDAADVPAGVAAETLAAYTPQAMADLATQVAGLNTQVASTTPPPPPADVLDEIGGAGPAFGTFLGKIGEAVAETQKALDLSMVATAEALSAKSVKVASVFEQVVKDDGSLDQANIHFQEVPLITLVTPSALQFTQVHVTADMEVEEFRNDVGMQIKKSHTDFNANARAKYSLLGGFGASGSTAFNYSNDDLSTSASVSTDKAAGKLHMEATIEPRTIPLPQPFVVQKGPRLQLMMQSRRDLDAGGAETTDPAAVKSREVVIKALLVGSNGAPLSGALSVTCDGGFPFTLSSPTTDATTGELTITVRRGGITPENSGLQETTVRASMKLVTASMQFGI